MIGLKGTCKISRIDEGLHFSLFSADRGPEVLGLKRLFKLDSVVLEASFRTGGIFRKEGAFGLLLPNPDVLGGLPALFLERESPRD